MTLINIRRQVLLNPTSMSILRIWMDVGLVLLFAVVLHPLLDLGLGEVIVRSVFAAWSGVRIVAVNSPAGRRAVVFDIACR